MGPRFFNVENVQFDDANQLDFGASMEPRFFNVENPQYGVSTYSVRVASMEPRFFNVENQITVTLNQKIDICFNGTTFLQRGK